MTTTSEFVQTRRLPLGRDTYPIQRAPAHALSGGRLVLRATQAFIGVVLILAAIGLWAAPGADWSGEVLLIKLVLSLAMVLGGTALLHTPKNLTTPAVEIDTIRREVRLVRRGRVQDDVVETHKFADLERAELHGAHMALWATDGVLLAEVGMDDANIRNSLTTAMRQAGKL